MGSDVVLFGWNQPVPGREGLSAHHFQEFVEYLGALKRDAVIESFDTVLLEPHGGALNGFILLRGEGAKLAQLTASPEWVQHQVRAIFHLNGCTVLRGVSGAGVEERMGLWTKELQKHPA